MTLDKSVSAVPAETYLGLYLRTSILALSKRIN